MKTLISHEVPKVLFPFHDYINDYPYLLCHLLMPERKEYDFEYAAFYKEAVKRYSYSILDNSAFELGYAIGAKDLAKIAQEYNPTHIVIPDSFGNKDETIQLVEENLPYLLKNTSCKMFAVIQGKTIEEMIDCYDYYASIKEIDVIGVTFGKLAGNKTRSEFIRLLNYSRKVTKKIHLLGCSNPLEYTEYNVNEKELIYSVDTSSPIINGWKGNLYTDKGLECEKPKEKLAENLNMALTQEQINQIAYNVRKFKTFLYDNTAKVRTNSVL